MKKRLLLVVCYLALASSLYGLAADISLGFNVRNTDATGFFPQIDISANHQFAGLGFNFEMYGTTDGLYPPPESQFGKFYILIKEGGITYDTGPLHLSGGITRQKDIVDTPYSMFFSSNGNSALGAKINYDDGIFFYESRWIQLNFNSALYKQDYPVTTTTGATTTDVVSAPFDRGLNYRTIGFHIGDFRLAYLESAVYTGRAFDYYYFLVPIPGYFTQYIRSAAGSPWQESKPWGDSANDNFIVGIMLDYQHDDWYGVFEFLLDDINLNRIIKPSGPQNPDKIAFQTGARYRSPIGTFGLFSAMATKYTFQPMGDASTNTRYGYTYYPDIVAGGQAIPLNDNYIGYVNGENNLAFILQYQNVFSGFKIDAGLDFTLTGSQSPVNPWGTNLNWYDAGQGTHWLDDPVLEKKLRLKAAVAYDLDPFTFVAGFMVGIVWNELQMVSSGDAVNPSNILNLYQPSNTTRFIGSFTLTAILHLREAPKPAEPAPESAKPETAKPSAADETDKNLETPKAI